MKNIAELHDLEARRNGHRPYKVEFKEGKGGKKTLVLPPTPDPDDIVGMREWLTTALARDPTHPVTGATRRGAEGPEGLLAIHRGGKAPDIVFEPVRHMNSPARLSEALMWYRVKSDPRPYGYTSEHCGAIAHVAGTLAEITESETIEQEAEGIIGAFTQAAEAITGFTTRGTRGQTFEAAVALRRDIDEMSGRPKGAPRFLAEHIVDDDGTDWGELTIPVGELTGFARGYLGRSLPHGWLDSRMSAIGWERLRLDAHGLGGRMGNRGPHARLNVYRGRLPMAEIDESVST